MSSVSFHHPPLLLSFRILLIPPFRISNFSFQFSVTLNPSLCTGPVFSKPHFSSFLLSSFNYTFLSSTLSSSLPYSFLSSSLTLLVLDGPDHEVHTGGVGLAAQLERAGLSERGVRGVQDALQLRLAAAELLQDEVMHLPHKVRLQGWRGALTHTRKHTTSTPKL